MKWSENLLPKDGIARYAPYFIPEGEMKGFIKHLSCEIDWKHDEFFMFGRKITTKRAVAFYGDYGVNYTYTKVEKIAQPWTKELLRIKVLVEQVCQTTFNACLLNLYHDGTEGMGWHSDDEPEMKPGAPIASVSFGAARRFSFRHKITKEKISLDLTSGSVLLMKGKTQTHWQHSLPPTKKEKGQRINLTFRTLLP